MRFDREDLSQFVGKSFIYNYDKGWRYELYVKNRTTIDYRVHSGIVAGRWVKDQTVCLARVGENLYRVSWTEPTGTDVSLTLNLHDFVVHGAIYFPRWIVNNPEKIACYQNEHLEEMEALRDAGPIYPTEIIDSFATLIYIRDCGSDNEQVIACPPSELPEDYPFCLPDKNLLPESAAIA
ncbi:putative phenolic acid decarboxylase [Vibrio nigripulchritudo]|uniref:phenolic acid decarboxylase n=1 Tax=Vibrio nigripulchritudo TaxID=28173 RepID=UPI00190DBA39|nr:phenolic acid decarboxylase [Vibrio nigripulchritudo]BCL73412.1 putative phenolic acid decarboxylase [Vibrio nigripulchritudo]BDU34779.1 putative phenolic acid decarboxylase [Vibrio nigripulchritudo]